MVAETWNEKLMLDRIDELIAVHHLFCERSLPWDVLFAIRVSLHLHDQFLNLGEVAIRICHRAQH